MRKLGTVPGNAAKRTQNDSITIRRITFPVTDCLNPILVEGLPEESFFYVGLSLLFPQLEPYLIRTLQQAKRHIGEPQLLADVDAFIGQESQHYKQHIRFNKSLNLEKYPKLNDLVADIEADYQRFTKTRSLRFNLAYAEGFEAGTLAGTRFAFEVQALKRLHPVAQDFFQWHLIEEFEHRNVTFDAYGHVSGSYSNRVIVGLFAQWHLSRFLFRVARYMIRADKIHFQKTYGGIWHSFKRLTPVTLLVLWRLLPKLLGTHMPWYSPHNFKMSDHTRALAREYSAKARSGKNPSEVNF